MFCKNCGEKLNNNDLFCKNCGTKLDDNLNNSTNNFNYNSNNYQKSDPGATVLILGIISIVFSGSFIFGIIIGTIGLIMGLRTQNISKKGKIGKVLNIIGICLSVLIMAFFLFVSSSLFSSIIENTSFDKVINSFSSDKNFFGDGYTFKYNDDWSLGVVSESKRALKYKDSNSYFVPIGKSSLSEMEINYSINFDTSNGKDVLYNKFYDFWSSSLASDSLYLYKSDELKILKDDIYYATYNYGKSEDDLRGKYYLVISSLDDVVFSFMTNSTNPTTIDDKTLNMLKSIDIDVITDSNLESEISDYLDTI